MKDRPLIAVINQYILENKIFDPVLEGLSSAVRYDKTYFDKIVASLLPLLENSLQVKLQSFSRLITLIFMMSALSLIGNLLFVKEGLFTLV